jgi:histidinol-phosphate aminotransferase
LVTRGSSEAIDLLMRVFCEAGRNSIVTTRPTFSMYRHYATVQGAAVREVECRRDEDFAIDVDAILDACDDTVRIVFICSPNNPTGTLVPRAALIDLLVRCGDRAAVVVDEAYIEFAGQPSAVELLDRFDNLLVLRTLSKALAFAGARCGAVIGAPEVIDMLDAVQAPYALATPVVECVEDALQAEGADTARTWVRQIVAERDALAAAVSRFGFVRRIWPSAANFILVQVDDALAVMKKCGDEGVLLRHFGAELADCVRITVGSPAENRRLLQALATLQE